MKKLKKILTQTSLFFFSAASSALAATSTNDDIFGQIQAPKGVAQYDAQVEGEGIGLIIFISNLIRLATIVAGIWVMINFILAGWDYIFGSGDPKSHKSATDKMINSLIGLIIIISAYSIAGLIGAIFFGNASYIINPKIQGI